jgi:WXG100 family type VII secretion target
MAYGAGEILVTFASIAEAASNTNSTVSSMNSELDDLKSAVAKVTADWTGQAAEAYQQQQAQWNSAQQDLTAVLQKISQVLEQAGDAYQSTESSNAASWG